MTEAACARPVIGIVMTQVPEGAIQRISCHYLHAVVDAGGLPLLIPVVGEADVTAALLARVDGVLLTGGQDIVPATYGEALSADPTVAGTVESTPARDASERLILDEACRRDLPCAGICRGMQMMSCYFGGTLYQDLDREFVRHGGAGAGDGGGARHGYPPIRHRQPLDGGFNRVHGVAIGAGTALARAFGAGELMVNSLHHQGVRELGRGLVASGVSDDGLIEGIEHPGYSHMVGVQWHPEYFGGAGAPMHAYFTELVEAARRRRERAGGR